MFRQSFQSKQGGFTLIEVMLVIAIMAIMVSLIVMNIQGVEQRRIMQARELLLLDLQRIRLEAVDQGRILGLVSLPATDLVPASYQVLEYLPDPKASSLNQATQRMEKTFRWQVAQDFQIKALPEQAYLVIEMQDTLLNLDTLKQQQQTLPQAIWLGNGEVIPTRMQLYLQQQTIGDVIELNRLGLVVQHESSL